MKLSKLLANVKIRGTYRDREIYAVAVNSEDVRPGTLFIAVRGEKEDGGEYIERAISKGAACVLTERESAGFHGCEIITAENCREAASYVFSEFYGNPGKSLRLAAVTGTNGKTTVAKLTEHIFSFAGYKTGFIGTLGASVNEEKFGAPESDEEKKASSLTTPGPEYLYKILAQMKNSGCDSVVMEASSHALALSRLDALHFDIGAFLNLSRDHLDFHLTEENYFEAKKRLCKMSERFIVNFDDKYGKRLALENPDALAFSAVPETAADDRVFATACACKNRGAAGMEYLYYSKNAIFKVKTKMWGMNAVYNSMAASLIALSFGIAPVVVQGAVACFGGVRGRMEVLPIRRGEALFIIDYAHTPDALEKAIKNAREAMRGGRLILVFGCGGERDTTKRKIMGSTADKLADFTYVTSDNPRGEDPLEIIAMIEEGFGRTDNHVIVADRREALICAVNQSRQGDFVLVCGKGHEDYIIDKNGKRYFSEREIIETALDAKRAG